MTAQTQQIEAWLRSWVGRFANLEPSQVDPRDPIIVYGLDSLAAASLTEELERWLDTPLPDVPATVSWDYVSIQALAAHLAHYVPGQAEPTLVLRSQDLE
jgi:acyl carrier protein